MTGTVIGADTIQKLPLLGSRAMLTGLVHDGRVANCDAGVSASMVQMFKGPVENRDSGAVPQCRETAQVRRGWTR